MKIEFVVSKNLNDLKAFARVIQDHKLHLEEHGTIEHLTSYLLTNVRRYAWYCWIKNKTTCGRPAWIITLCYLDGNPVGCLLLNAFSIHFYVKPEFRKLGIASLLFQITNLRYDLSMKVLNYDDTVEVNQLKNKFNIKSTIEEIRKS